MRTQRVATEKGLNARWLWEHLKRNTKVVIWDDGARRMPYPDDDKELYYNPEGGSYYHSDQYCSVVKNKYLPLTAFPYVELDSEKFLDLEPCLTCQPPRRKSLIARENFNRGAITEEELEEALTPKSYPDPNEPQYYNPEGGKYYHGDQNCSSVKDRWLPLTAFDYGELETGAFASLTPCPHCDPLPRLDEVDAYNIKQGISEERVAQLRESYEAGSAQPSEEALSEQPYVDVSQDFANDEEVSVIIR